MDAPSFLVSVIIPTFGRPFALKRAILSVLKQTYHNIEIIVVDDNGIGTDNQIKTYEIISKYHNIRYIAHEINKNGSAARNTGWRASKGEYITFLDDDDEMATNKIEEQIIKIKSLPMEYGACYCRYHIIKRNKTIIKSGTRNEGDVYVQALSRNFYVGSGSNLLVKRTVIEKLGGFDESFQRNQDIEFMARLFEICYVGFVDLDLLTIHLEENRIKRPYDFIESVTDFYLQKMSSRIEKINKNDKKKVIEIISLDRARLSFVYGNRKKMFFYLKKVSIVRKIKYLLYLSNRFMMKKSYGFFK